MPVRLRRCSEAMKSTSPGAPARTAPRAFTSPVVPARSEEVTSRVAMSVPRLSASAQIPEFCRSVKGRVVEARWTADTALRSASASASRAASTAIVTLSSSQLHIDRSPRPCAASAPLAHAFARRIAER